MDLKCNISRIPKKREEVNIKEIRHALFKESIFSIITNYKKTRNSFLFESIISYLKQKPIPSKLCTNILIQLRETIPLLDKETEQFIMSIMQIPWQCGDETVELHFTNFVLSLVTARNYFVSPIFECLIKQLIPVLDEKTAEDRRLNPFYISKEEQTTYNKILGLIKTIAMHVPLCHNLLMKIICSSCPFYKHHVHIHTVFTYNMLVLMKLIPSLKTSILEIIISNALKLDLHSPRSELDNDSDDESDAASEELFPMEIEEDKSIPEVTMTPHTIGHSLDSVMTLIFRYIHFVSHGGKDYSLLMVVSENSPFTVNGCCGGSVALIDDSQAMVTNGCECQGKSHDVEALKQLYLDLKQTTVKIILPTHSSAHAQFVIFYILSLRPSLVSDFLDLLKVTFETPSNSMEQKKSAAAFLGSLLVRGKFIKFSHVHYCLEILHNYCKSYLQGEFYLANKFEDLQLHHQFYCACMTLFYVFTFNYREYTESKSRWRLAQSLHLDELVLSPLNPLRFCCQALTVNFAAITCHFQLAYCYSVLQRNCRLFLPMSVQNSYGVFQSQSSILDMYFPFDPYLLKRSDSFICRHYKEFEGLSDEILRHSANMSRKEQKANEQENWDSEENLFWNSPESIKFSYEMSPGFKSF